MTEFRISVNLHSFYRDYRSQSRVFISAEMKTIHDLQNHISNLFQLSGDFYLMCNNFYLPYYEDVRILKEDDAVSIIAESFVEGGSKVKKRKRDCTEKENECSVLKVPHKKTTEAILIKARKEYKSKKNKHKSCKDGDVDDSFVLQEKIEYEMEDTLLAEDVNQNTVKHVEFTQKKDIKFKSKTSSEVEKAKQSDVICENKYTLTKPKKKIELLPICKIPKIIKSIIVHDFTSIVPQAEEKPPEQPVEEFPNNEEIFVEPICNAREVTQPVVDIAPVVVSNNDDKLIEENLQSTSEEPMEFEETTVEVNESVFQKERSSSQNCSSDEASNNKSVQDESLNGKKKRHRVRKRNKKSKKVHVDGLDKTLPFVTAVAHSTPVIQPTHIKFNDDDIDDAENIISQDNCSKSTVLENQNIDNAPEVTENGVIGNKLESITDDRNVLVKDDINYQPENVLVKKDDIKKYQPDEKESTVKQLSGQDITQYPLMKDIFPKTGDVIAFKIFILSETYTPEISKTIIGKVKTYKPKQKLLQFTFFEGGEQCRDHTGKFSLDDPEEAEIKDEFLWQDLLEPRLLFP